MRPIQGEFPDYRQVVREQSPNRAEVPVGAWVDVLRRVEILSSERTRGVRLRFSEGLLEVSAATPDVGEASDAVEIRYAGQPLTMGFNVRYLLQALETFSRQALAEVGLKDEATQGVIRVDEDPSFLYVVMPMRL
jgi:DNA polymerase-3 subunit beta